MAARHRRPRRARVRRRVRDRRLRAGGVVVAAWAVSAIVTGGSGFVPPGTVRALALMVLEATVMLTISIAGGTRFSTVTNGMLALGVFGLGFMGGWVEHIGV